MLVTQFQTSEGVLNSGSNFSGTSLLNFGQELVDSVQEQSCSFFCNGFVRLGLEQNVGLVKSLFSMVVA